MLVALVASALGPTACAPVMKAPPKAPAMDEPHVENAPTSPAPADKTRVILDADGERARVSTLTPATGEEWLLCVTPCAVDLVPGSHTLYFASTENHVRSSTALVAIPKGAGATTIVRHAMGTEGWINNAYGGGALLTLLGSGIMVLGGAVTAIGAVGEPTRQEDGTMFDPRDVLLPGIALLGSGIAMTTGGVVMMMRNRPVVQHGATTTWTKP